jgi:hypothetical protein
MKKGCKTTHQLNGRRDTLWPAVAYLHGRSSTCTSGRRSRRNHEPSRTRWLPGCRTSDPARLARRRHQQGGGIDQDACYLSLCPGPPTGRDYTPTCLTMSTISGWRSRKVSVTSTILTYHSITRSFHSGACRDLCQRLLSECHVSAVHGHIDRFG